MRDNAIVIPMGALRRIVAMLLIVIALIVVLLVVRTQLFRAGLSTLFAPGAAELIDRNAYQALFLANGSTYFGKLQEQGEAWFALTDVFYLASTDQSGAQLVKRGAEPQGPREPMIVSKQQVLFIENLREDGEIVTAIKRFKSGQLPIATAPPPTPARTTAPPTAQPSATR
jgi:hypothetical protein